MGWEGRVVVFVGPSFRPDRVAEFVPGAEVRFPIKRGDLDAIEAPAVVAVIDGIFDAELAITTREIRDAIGRGLRVVGASSMGALRAAEVPQMIGVGRVYEAFRDGTLERDDEVALLLDRDTGRALTEPLVNVRFAVEALVRSASLDAKAGEAIIEAASRLHFHERVYRHILREAGFPAGPGTDVLTSALRSFDAKGEDAQTLLERLPELGVDARWNTPTPAEEVHRYDDHFDAVEAESAASGDAPLLVWEYGEGIAVEDLRRFLAVTGRADAVFEQLAACGLDDAAPSEDAPAVPTVQEVFEAIRSTWGWLAPEEVHVTLGDLGIGFQELQEQLRAKRAYLARRHAWGRATTASIARALRTTMLMDDLALKREVMRLSAISFLASLDGGAEVTPAEIDDARRACLCNAAHLTWEGLLDEGSATEDEVSAILVRIARARRCGVSVAERMSGARRQPSSPARGVDMLPAVRRLEGHTRSVSDAEAAATSRRLAQVIGVTRIAQLGQLEAFDLHVSSVYRPSNWSSTVASGKSETPEGAIAGGVMEEVEKYCQDLFQPEVVATAPFTEQRRGSLPAVDPATLGLPYDSFYTAQLAVSWTWAEDLVSGERVAVPTAVLAARREMNDVLFSARCGRKVFSSNGLASAFTLTEALLHALCELIERHALKLSEQAIQNPGELAGARLPGYRFVDLSTCPPRTRRVIDKIRGAGYEVRVLDVTSDVTVPTFTARLMRAARVHGLESEYCAGSCTHPDPTVAIERALLEAVQARLASLSGAREDLGMKARSLGRHERPRPISRGDAFWIRPSVPKVPFSDLRNLCGDTVRDDLARVVGCLTAAGFDRILYRDLTTAEVEPAHVVRVLVPGLEDNNPFHTGIRARVQIVSDLMQRHGW